MTELLDPSRLQTVHNFAAAYTSKSGKTGVSVGYIYRLISEGKVEAVTIDGMKFIVLPPPPPKQ